MGEEEEEEEREEKEEEKEEEAIGKSRKGSEDTINFSITKKLKH